MTIWETDKPILVNPESSPYPIFKTEQIYNAYTEFNRLQIKTEEITEDENVISFRFFDIDGNVLELCQLK